MHKKITYWTKKKLINSKKNFLNKNCNIFVEEKPKITLK